MLNVDNWEVCQSNIKYLPRSELSKSWSFHLNSRAWKQHIIMALLIILLWYLYRCISPINIKIMQIHCSFSMENWRGCTGCIDKGLNVITTDMLIMKGPGCATTYSSAFCWKLLHQQIYLRFELVSEHFANVKGYLWCKFTYLATNYTSVT